MVLIRRHHQLQKLVVGCLLHLYEVGHRRGGGDATERLTNTLAARKGINHYNSLELDILVDPAVPGGRGRPRDPVSAFRRNSRIRFAGHGEANSGECVDIDVGGGGTHQRAGAPLAIRTS